MNNALDNTELPRSWVRSSYSNGAGGECVECAHVDDIVFVRDSKVGDALVTRMGAQAWLAFTHATGRG
ncbi:DUF397 domain-containing protein [Streptomyces sp. NPDC093586]|uniref:DUF397 domain-containing protein n=1 Tax=Streptomyces sp. NPDC093586 TaxID=3366042 RepID=UPI00380E5030